MASLGATDLHVHITWDSEPTEEAKNFIRVEVLKALKDALGEGSWFKELVQAELKHTILSSGMAKMTTAHVYIDSQQVAREEGR